MPNDSIDHRSQGFVLGTGAGVAVDVSSDLYVSLEGGYQWGFQEVRKSNGVELSTSYVHVGLGVGRRF